VFGNIQSRAPVTQIEQRKASKAPKNRFSKNVKRTHFSVFGAFAIRSSPPKDWIGGMKEKKNMAKV